MSDLNNVTDNEVLFAMSQVIEDLGQDPKTGHYKTRISSKMWGSLVDCMKNRPDLLPLTKFRM